MPLIMVKETSDRASNLLEEIKIESDPAVRLGLYEHYRRCLLILLNISIDPASQPNLRTMAGIELDFLVQAGPRIMNHHIT